MAKEAQEDVVVVFPTISFNDNEQIIYRKHCGMEAKKPSKYQDIPREYLVVDFEMKHLRTGAKLAPMV
jgi:hypothetical protein